MHTSHVKGSGPEPRLGLFFETRHWVGEPANREPDKCSAIAWFPLNALPDQLIEYPAAGIHAYRHNLTFGALGWPTRTATGSGGEPVPFRDRPVEVAQELGS